MSPKVIIIGLDSVPPSLAFEQYRSQMPHLSSLCEQGTFGPMRSTDPPITIPAWISMTTGKTPGQLGIYGFQKYTDSRTARLVTTDDIRFPRIWDLAAAADLKSVVVSVPLTYPAKASSHITMTTGFLTPDTRTRWATRPSLARQLTAQFGEYIIDVSDFRNTDMDRIYTDCTRFTQQHFAIFRHLIQTESPHFAMMVDLGPDRLHHAALRHILQTHPAFIDSKIGERYYKTLDEEIGRTLDLAGPDTLVMIVSDHGVKPLHGCFCLNELLIQNGHLVLDESYPTTPLSLEQLRVDWTRTTAVAKGGYVGRIYITSSTHQHELRNKIRDEILAVHAPTTAALHHHILDRDTLYPDGQGHPPDLTIYFDDLNLRAAGTIGHNRLFIPTNDQGPDDANHDYLGIFAANQKLNEKAPFQIYDVFSTALHALGIPEPAECRGSILQLS